MTLENDPYAAGLLSSVVTATYRAHGYTHASENQQRGVWGMSTVGVVRSRVFCRGEAALQQSICIREDESEELI